MSVVLPCPVFPCPPPPHPTSSIPSFLSSRFDSSSSLSNGARLLLGSPLFPHELPPACASMNLVPPAIPPPYPPPLFVSHTLTLPTAFLGPPQNPGAFTSPLAAHRSLHVPISFLLPSRRSTSIHLSRHQRGVIFAALHSSQPSLPCLSPLQAHSACSHCILTATASDTLSTFSLPTLDKTGASNLVLCNEKQPSLVSPNLALLQVASLPPTPPLVPLPLLSLSHLDSQASADGHVTG